jgi:putative DNA primase/helicase
MAELARDAVAQQVAAALGLNGHGSDIANTYDINDAAFTRTDLGMAKRLVARHGHNLRFVHAWRKWLHWNGSRWTVDETGEAMRLAKETARSLLNAALDRDDKPLGRHALAYHAAARFDATLKLATSEPSIPVQLAELDADDWMLNCQNGLFDLRTLTLRPHDRAALCTKITAAPYLAEARSPVWGQFLADVADGDPDVAGFLQRAAGSSITGCTRDEKLFFAYGPRWTGKTTFLEAIAATLGSYATTADFSTFLAHRDRSGSAPTPDIARLRGARFVKSVEVGKAEGARLAEGLVKQLTGGDIIVARHLHKEPFEFKTTHHLWLGANDAPKISDDDALKRRLLRVPFVHSFERDGEPPDPAIKAALTDPTQAGPAILRWLVVGCRDWKVEGLNPPGAVLHDTASYFDENDPLREFLAADCVTGPDYHQRAGELYGGYTAWAKRNGLRPQEVLSNTAFGLKMRRRYEKRDHRTGAFYRGVALRNAREGPDGDI